MPDGNITAAHIEWCGISDRYELHIEFPRTGRSHYYSLVNYLENLWIEQYPEYEYRLRMQTRGTMTFNPHTNPINL